MTFRRFENAAAFLEATEPLLLTEEAKYGLALGVAQRCRDGEPFGPEPPWFGALEEAGRASVAAIHTPPFALNLTDATESAIEEIIEALIAEERQPRARRKSKASCQPRLPCAHDGRVRHSHACSWSAPTSCWA